MTKYNYDEVFKASIEYFEGDELAASVFAGKYALQDSDGNYLEKTPNDMHKRLASEFARIEKGKKVKRKGKKKKKTKKCNKPMYILKEKIIRTSDVASASMPAIPQARERYILVGFRRDVRSLRKFRWPHRRTTTAPTLSKFLNISDIKDIATHNPTQTRRRRGRCCAVPARRLRRRGSKGNGISGMWKG